MNEIDGRTEPARALMAGLSTRLQLFLSLAEQCLGQPDDEQVWRRQRPRDNAIGNLVLHAAGNMRQAAAEIQGTPDVRDRPAEFSATGGLTRSELAADLGGAVRELDGALHALPLERLGETYHLRTGDTTMAYALIMSVSHFGLHLGQMQFIAKGILGEGYKEASWRLPPA